MAMPASEMFGKIRAIRGWVIQPSAVSEVMTATGADFRSRLAGFLARLPDDVRFAVESGNR